MSINIINNLKSNQLMMLLPERISEFAAHMACYIWFSDYQQQPSNNTNSNSNSIIDVQSSSNWSLSLEIPPGGSYVNCQRFNEYKPKDPFKKFCLDVLATTQISFPAVLLSLLYIHRMKIRNPKIKGQNGSEYRTFTVALMLANKFLDDNTYTNKTWSEVTRIPVAEINTMEIEFLTTSTYSYNNPSQPTIEIGSTSYNNYFGNLLLPLTTATVV
ncbi:10602_t:CDS:2 [Entrophospora sp. SA101]|nr:10602_t:CDS:2 [Entrophospora sp. SA101]